MLLRKRERLILPMEIEFADNKGIEELKQKLKMELGSIVRRVKSLKARAEEIKGILEEIERQEKEAGPVKDPA